MKKYFVTIILSITSLVALNAQFTKIGAGLTYGTGFHFNNTTEPTNEAILHRGPFSGIYLKGIYELKQSVHIVPSFTFLIPRTNKVFDPAPINNISTRVSAMMFDLNGHYIFNSSEKFRFYGLAGLNVTFAKIKWLGDFVTSGTDNTPGLNIGGGTYMKLTEKIDLNAEIKYILSKYDQLMINAGFLVSIDFLKK